MQHVTPDKNPTILLRKYVFRRSRLTPVHLAKPVSQIFADKPHRHKNNAVLLREC